MVTAAEARTLIDEFHSKQVPHQRQVTAQKLVEASLADAILDRKATVLAGPSGVGKTNLVDLIELDRLARLQAAGEPGRYHFLRVTALAPTNRRYRIQGLYTSILDEADEVARDRKRLVIHRQYRGPSDAIQQAAINVLRHRRPYVFCVDEIQHMVYGNDESELRSHFDNLKVLADKTNVPMLLVGTPEVLNVALCSSQLGRRLRYVEFLPYRPIDLADHFEAVLYFIAQLPIGVSFDATSRADDFFELSVGSVGLLKEWFETVLREGLDEGKTAVTWGDFEVAAMGRGRLQKLAEDYREAERLLAALGGQRASLRRTLGLDPDDGGDSPAPSKPRGGPRRPGQRVLRRDPVGT